MTLRHLIFHHFWLKLFSIALGTIIWLAIHHSIDNDFTLYEPAARQRLIRESIVVPISPVMLEGDTRTFRLTPTNATITVVGTAGALHGLPRRDIKIFVDLTDFRGPGAAQLDLFPGVPHDINVIDFKPHSVSVETINH